MLDFSHIGANWCKLVQIGFLLHQSHPERTWLKDFIIRKGRGFVRLFTHFQIGANWCNKKPELPREDVAERFYFEEEYNVGANTHYDSFLI